MTNRKQKRSKKKFGQKRQYSYDEVQQIVNSEMFNLRKKYDVMYSVAIATTLNAEPFNFGRLRVCRAANLLFGQLDAIQKGVLDADVLAEEAAKLGVITTQTDDGRFEVYLDPGEGKSLDSGV